MPYVCNYPSEPDFLKYRRKNNTPGFYEQLVIETYKCEYELRQEFKTKKELLATVIILLINATFLPAVLFLWYFSIFTQLYAILLSFIIIILTYSFAKKFGTYLIKKENRIKTGTKPGVGFYVCLFCRTSIKITEHEQELIKCTVCGESDFIRIEERFLEKIKNFLIPVIHVKWNVGKILLLALITNVIILLLINNPLWAIPVYTFLVLLISAIIYFVIRLSVYFLKKKKI
jgi:DNA-directed RNA polymerase subunit RPC12/RpoP